MNGAHHPIKTGTFATGPRWSSSSSLENDVRAIHDDISYRSVSLSFSIALRNNIPSNSAK